jgi:methylated-DNA-[protein]-cysteine S-methyltransferase
MKQRQLSNGRAGQEPPCESAVFKTHWGWMGIAASSKGVTGIVLPQASRRLVEKELNGSRVNGAGGVASGLLGKAREQMLEFLTGKRRTLDLPVDLSQGTAFQRRVWRAALGIPYGRVRSYQWLAQRVGGRQYARAVGLAPTRCRSWCPVTGSWRTTAPSAGFPAASAPSGSSWRWKARCRR